MLLIHKLEVPGRDLISNHHLGPVNCHDLEPDEGIDQVLEEGDPGHNLVLGS